MNRTIDPKASKQPRVIGALSPFHEIGWHGRPMCCDELIVGDIIFRCTEAEGTHEQHMVTWTKDGKHVQVLWDAVE